MDSRLHCNTKECARRHFSKCNYCNELVCCLCLSANYKKYVDKYPECEGTQADNPYPAVQFCRDCRTTICNWIECVKEHDEICRTDLYWSFGIIDYDDSDNFEDSENCDEYDD